MDSEYLNEEQTLAVETIDGYVQVAAGAGTGKTNTLAYRFKSLIEDEGLRPENIACITFTRKAAHEMKMRIKDITDEEDQGFITTFHGLCVRILREDGNVIYWPNSFGILDEGESKTIMKKLFSKYGLDYSKNTYEEIMAVIGEIKNRFSEWYVNPMTFKDPKILDEYAEKVCNDKRICKYYKEHQLDIFFDYLREQKKLHHLDYNDVINLVLVIFATHENIRKKWAKKLEYIMVDEFQDVNLKQYNLLLNLDRGTENLFVVGDIDQCIYKWRGAAPELFKNFTKNFEPCEIIHMNKNYRSTQAILDTANTLIE